MKPLPKSFFAHDAVLVAQKLLGKVISTNGCSGMIVETEAYKADPASHAYTKTPRSDIMYTTYAKWYIYFIYGMYHCMNITTNGTTEPGAVLIRALEPLEGFNMMKKRRKTDDIHNLCSGPGKVCQALGIDKQLNGTDVNARISVYDYKKINKKDIVRTSRIGIKQGTELEWRFYVKGNRFVSRK